MRDVKYGRAFAGLLLTIVGLMAGATEASSQVHNTAAASPAPGSGPQARFSDPFAYCAAVGTIDAPDARYTGPKVPEVVAQGLKKAFGAPADAPLGPFLRTTVWRGMDGQVYACTVGANLLCQERVDVRRTPTQGMTQESRQLSEKCRPSEGLSRGDHGMPMPAENTGLWSP
jgi:hypothetical protein